MNALQYSKKNIKKMVIMLIAECYPGTAVSRRRSAVVGQLG